MNIIDHIAQEHSYLLNGTKFDDCAEQKILSNFIDEHQNSMSKTASFSPFFERIFQGTEEDYHQNDETKDFWKIQSGKLVRIVSKQVKG